VKKQPENAIFGSAVRIIRTVFRVGNPSYVPWRV